MNLVGAGRSYVFMKVKQDSNNTWILFSFIIIGVLATAISWQGYISMLPLLATSAVAVASWQNNPKHIRRLMMLAPPLWFAYNAISGSYPGMVIEIIMLASNLVGQYRFDFLKKSEKSMTA